MTKPLQTVAHSVSSVISRHPLHAIKEFTNEAERDAYTYSAKDVGKCVKVLSPLKYWLIISQSAGVAVFRELAPDLAAFIAGSFGTTAGTICEGNDPRLGGTGGPHAGSHLPGGTDALATAAAGTITPGDSAGEGAASSYARSDHTHAIAAFGSAPDTFCEGDDLRLSDARTPTAHASAHVPGGADALATAAPGAITPGDAANEGAASSYARSDHTHAIATFGSAPDTFCEGDDPRLSDARTPTAHAAAHLPGGLDALATGTPGAIIPGDMASEGLAASYARSDHKHAMAAFAQWTPDAPPTAPHASDDEFTAGALDPKWSVFDPGALLTVGMDTNRRMVTLTGSGNGGARIAGISQPVPAGGEFAFYAKVHMNAPLERGGVGIFIADDIATSPNAADLVTAYSLNVGTSALPHVGWQAWTAFNASGASNSINYGRPGHRMYIRMRVNGNVVRSDFSDDGIAFTEMDSSFTTGYTPAYFGIFLYTLESGVSFKGMADFFRVFSGPGTSGIDATSIGRLISFGVS